MNQMTAQKMVTALELTNVSEPDVHLLLRHAANVCDDVAEPLVELLEWTAGASAVEHREFDKLLDVLIAIKEKQKPAPSGNGREQGDGRAAMLRRLLNQARG